MRAGWPQRSVTSVGQSGSRQCDFVFRQREVRYYRHNAAKGGFQIFRFLTDVSASGETDARASFKTYCTETRRRGLAVVISDFFDGHGFESALDILRHFRHDIFVVHVASHEEIDPG